MRAVAAGSVALAVVLAGGCSPGGRATTTTLPPDIDNATGILPADEAVGAEQSHTPEHGLVTQDDDVVFATGHPVEQYGAIGSLGGGLLENYGDDAITLLGIVPLHVEGLTLLGAVVAGSARQYGMSTTVAGYPPDVSHFGPVVDLSGFVLEPASPSDVAPSPGEMPGVEIVVGFRLRDDATRGLLDGYCVHYRVGDAPAISQRCLKLQLQVCPSPPNAADRPCFDDRK